MGKDVVKPPRNHVPEMCVPDRLVPEMHAIVQYAAPLEIPEVVAPRVLDVPEMLAPSLPEMLAPTMVPCIPVMLAPGNPDMLASSVPEIAPFCKTTERPGTDVIVRLRTGLGAAKVRPGARPTKSWPHLLRSRTQSAGSA